MRTVDSGRRVFLLTVAAMVIAGVVCGIIVQLFRGF